MQGKATAKCQRCSPLEDCPYSDLMAEWPGQQQVSWEPEAQPTMGGGKQGGSMGKWWRREKLQGNCIHPCTWEWPLCLSCPVQPALIRLAWADRVTPQQVHLYLFPGIGSLQGASQIITPCCSTQAAVCSQTALMSALHLRWPLAAARGITKACVTRISYIVA